LQDPLHSYSIDIDQYHNQTLEKLIFYLTAEKLYSYTNSD